MMEQQRHRSSPSSSFAVALFLSGAATGIAVLLIFQKYYRRETSEQQRPTQQHDNNDEETQHHSNLDESFPAPRRFGGAIKLKPEQYRRYRALHDNVWPQVLRRMYQSNMRNFTIYFHAETNTMFMHYEWIGHWKKMKMTTTTTTKNSHKRPLTTTATQQEALLFATDMQAIADDAVTREWWKECEPCQQPFSQWPTAESRPLSEGGKGDWWAPLECVNHCGHWPTAYSNQTRDPDFVPLAPAAPT